MRLKRNVGTIDGAIRMLLALLFAYLGCRYSAWWYVLAAIFSVTAVMGFCSIYKLFGISTVGKN